MDISSLVEESKAEEQIKKLSQQIADLSSTLVAQQQEKSTEAEGLRGSLQMAEKRNSEIASKLDEVVEGFRGVQSITSKQHEEVKTAVNGLNSKIKKLEGNAENFDSLAARVKKLEDELAGLKKLEKDRVEKTANQSTTIEKVVDSVQAAQASSQGYIIRSKVQLAVDQVDRERSRQ